MPFLLGHRPSIGDFGLLAPIYAHLYRDPVPGFILRTRWVYRGCCEVLLGVVSRCRTQLMGCLGYTYE